MLPLPLPLLAGGGFGRADRFGGSCGFGPLGFAGRSLESFFFASFASFASSFEGSFRFLASLLLLSDALTAALAIFTSLTACL